MKSPAVCTCTPVSFSNILFLTDFSPETRVALTYALTIARHFGARIFPAAAVVSLSETNNASAGAGPAESEALQQLSDMVCRTGLNYHPLATTDSVEKAVSRWTAEHSIDLIVLNTHGRRGLQRLQLGSTAESIFRNAECPVLTVGPFIRPRLPSLVGIHRVLFATDLSKVSETAAAFAVSIAREYRAHLTLMHALPAANRTVAGIMTDGLNARNRLLEFVPAEVSESCEVDFMVEEGDPTECILTTAREKDVDLIVLGLPQDKALSMHFRNGVTYDVVSSATAPVLTVRSLCSPHVGLRSGVEIVSAALSQPIRC